MVVNGWRSQKAHQVQAGDAGRSSSGQNLDNKKLHTGPLQPKTISICPFYVVHNRHRLHEQIDPMREQPRRPSLTVGHRRPGEIPQPHPELPKELCGSVTSLWFDAYAFGWFLGEATFRNVAVWRDFAKEVRGPGMKIFYVGNKSDLDRRVGQREVEDMMLREEGAMYF